MAAIEVRGLAKQFRSKVKRAGLKGSVASIFRPEYRDVTAVDGVSFDVPKGEIVAFIGPNGAGKSTTIKMLTGILHPSTGDARVLGFVPWRDRHALSFQVGSVFGQKSQLWFHLPPIDTFNLLGKIFEIPRARFAGRLEHLVATFQLADLLHTPVRRLSLGERMRCEIAASFLHAPQVIFLDEPTIGLDVVAKQRIRDLISHMNQEEGATIFLTSHDTGDIERLCKRVLVINDGRVILDTTVRDLKVNFIGAKLIEIRVAEPIKPFAMEGVTLLKQGQYGLKLSVDTHARSIQETVQSLVRSLPVVDITISDPPLDDIISKIYGRRSA